MQAVHALEAHKAQRYGLPLRDLLVRELEDLRRLRFARVRRVLEAERRPVYEELDQLWPLRRVCGVDHKRADAHGLVELVGKV